MANMTGTKFVKKDLLGSVKDISNAIKSGTHIAVGSQFLNEHKGRPQLYRMSSQPSQAHIDAMYLVENQAKRTFEAEVKRLVERPEPYL
jgi:hypothetical protein